MLSEETKRNLRDAIEKLKRSTPDENDRMQAVLQMVNLAGVRPGTEEAERLVLSLTHQHEITKAEKYFQRSRYVEIQNIAAEATNERAEKLLDRLEAILPALEKLAGKGGGE